MTKCLTKCKKVVLSLIVERDDSERARDRAKSANDFLRTKYKRHESVLVCHHDNIRDPRFRKHDKLNLNEAGTSRLASNLKYKIAQSLNITVEKKTTSSYENGTNRGFRSNDSFGWNDQRRNFNEDHGRFF